jgi:aminoglycoside phosphotransferase family enzyme/predicted kinase
MELKQLIAELSRPGAYPFAVKDVEVRQTHISVVFLAGPWAYKIKKPVAFSFVDFSTLEKRRYYCERELLLNRRLAPQVYQAVVPVAQTDTGLAFEQPGRVCEWAVKMVRLPEEATLEWRVQHSELDLETLRRLAERIAKFHSEAERSPEIACYARTEVLARLCRENLEVGQQQVGRTITASVWQRLQQLAEQWLEKLRPRFEERVARGVPCDTHGDLRLEHIYFFPDKPPPYDIAIIDCVEFNDSFRYADPVADMAFVVMDLLYEDRPNWARFFAESYFQASGDETGRELLTWYVSYRAAVRGKVRSLLAQEPEVPAESQQRAWQEARRYWMLAWQVLESPDYRPVLVLVSGLPGVGKSRLAQALAQRLHAVWLRSDAIRKELAGLPAGGAAATSFGQGIYTPQWTERTYTEMLRRTESLLADGRRVIVDATFAQEQHRQQFLNLAKQWAVPALLLLCQADPSVVRRRLAERQGDISDATWSVYEGMAQHWELPGPSTQLHTRPLHTDRDFDTVLAEAVALVQRTLEESWLPA